MDFSKQAHRQIQEALTYDRDFGSEYKTVDTLYEHGYGMTIFSRPEKNYVYVCIFDSSRPIGQMSVTGYGGTMLEALEKAVTQLIKTEEGFDGSEGNS